MTYETILSELYDSTYKMLELAQSKRWGELSEAESIRSKLMHNLDLHKPVNQSEESVAQKLREIIEVNQLITLLSIQEKDSCLTEFNQVKASKKATTEYSRY
jgi:hypothetical protein